MSLEADVEVRLGGLRLAVAVSAAPGEVTVVVGPNGAGKTTFLSCLAGTRPVDAGRIVLDGVVLDEPPDTFVPPERRRIGVVHQDHVLFPHLDALDNVAFGPRCAGRSRRAARDQAREWLGRVGVADVAGHRPGSLSGGQAQRVALARALAADPDALLLDEPLAALDAATRIDVRRELRAHLAAFGGPTVLVTHDPLDALVLADRVVVLEAGSVAQTGPIAEVAARPRSGYVAELLGTNLLVGIAEGGVVTLDGGGELAVTATRSGPVFLTVAPSSVALHRERPEGSPRNRWPTTVVALEAMGERIRVRLGPPIGLSVEVTVAAVAELGLVEGVPVWASVKATEIEAYPR